MLLILLVVWGLPLAAPVSYAAGSEGSIDLNFNIDAGIGPNNSINSMAAQSDGKTLIGGNFTNYNGVVSGRIARLNSDGSFDATFNAGFGADNTLYNIVVQSDGKILIGGNFTSYNGVGINYIARLNSDGSLDASFNPGAGPDATVTGIAQQSDGKILITGYFISYNGVGINYIARLNSDGSLDTSFNLVGGPDAAVQNLAIQSNGKILITGAFTNYNGVGRNRVARLNSDGSLDTSFNPGGGAGDFVFSVAIQSNGKILINGTFTSYDGFSRNRVARLNSDGSLDSSFNPGIGVDNLVISLGLQSDGKILIGGYFIVWNGISRNRIARLNADGSLDTSFNPGTGANDNLNKLLVLSDGKVLIGGNFTNYNGFGRNFLGRVNADGSFDTSFNPGGGTNSTVHSIVPLSNGKILIGGSFTSYNSLLASQLVRVNADGSLDTGFNSGAGPSSDVYNIAVQPDGKILIGGFFTSYNWFLRNRIARLNVDGSLDTSFNPGDGADNDVHTIAVQPDGKILIGGWFTSYNGVSRNRIARLNSDGSLDTSFNPGSGVNHLVLSMAVQPDGKILIGGWFTSYNGTARKGIARLNSDGSLDTSFNAGTGPNDFVQNLALQNNGKILIGGHFTSYNGVGRNRVARLNGDGSLDTSFNPGAGANNVLYSIALQNNGKILIGGHFTSYNGVSRNRIARLNGDGSLDTSFDPGAGANSFVNSLAIQIDGKILLGGQFTSVDNSPRNRLARLEAKIPSTLSVASNPNPSILGQPATFTATVQPATATGMVNFAIGATNVSVGLSGGIATYVTNTLPAGSYAVIATYGGSATYASSGDVGHTHAVIAPGSIQWQNANYSVGEGGGSVVLTATRSGGSDGAVSASLVVSEGTATAADYSLPANLMLNWATGETGAKIFVLPIVNDTTYEGNETLTLGLTSPTGGATLGSPATTTLTILEDNDKPATSITLTSPLNPAQFGQGVTLTAVVSLVAPATGVPSSGVVTFTEGAVVLGTTPVDASGVATLTLSTLGIGTHNLTAQYGGNANYLASPLSTQLIQVIKASKIKIGQ